jgi:hypothetical protein
VEIRAANDNTHVCYKYTRAFRVVLKFLVSQRNLSDKKTGYCGYEEVD